MIAYAVRRRESYRVSVVFDRYACSIGDTVSVEFRAEKTFRLPGLIVRYGISLSTKDGRRLTITSDPEKRVRANESVPGRGAYFSPFDVLSVRDAFGFFSAERRIPVEDSPRLVVLPEADFIAIIPEARTGGEAFRENPSFLRTNELSESRPYQPGDDPRRINWKMYGHSGDLFVREGDPEPPPRSRYAVIADCSVDSTLFSDEDGLSAVDALVGRALGLVVFLKEVGLEVEYGASGLSLETGEGKAAALHLAKAARVGLNEASELPLPEHPGERTVVFALPRRLSSEVTLSALDRFLASRSSVSAPLDLEFIEWRTPHGEGGRTSPLWKRALFRLDGATERSPRLIAARSAAMDLCVAAYSEKAGVRARRT